MPGYKDIEVVWLPEAEELLARRDRFTRREIKRDIAEHLEDGKVPLDPAQGWYATPVANNRYTVVWRAIQDRVVQVKAVLASQFRGESASELKSKLDKVVAFETNGLVKTLF